MYKVSVLVPVYKVEQYIERCVRSLFEQTYHNLEYVFVNDCTPDRSMEVLQRVIDEYPERYNAVRIVNHEKNKGLAAARNTALDLATGDFIYVIDSDDWIEKDAIELLLEKQFERDCDVVSGAYLEHFTNEEKFLCHPKHETKSEIVIAMMQRTWEHFFVGKLIRKAVFEKNGLRWNEGLDLAEDRYMSTIVAYYSNNYAMVENSIYHYDRRNENSYTNIIDRKKIIKGNSQELGNLLALEVFFMDKEKEYQKEVRRCVMEQLLWNFRQSVEGSSRDAFYETVRLIDSRNEEDWIIIGWKSKGLKGLINHSYYLKRLGWYNQKAIRFFKKKLK